MSIKAKPDSSRQPFTNAQGIPASDYVASDKLLVFTVLRKSDEPHKAGSKEINRYDVISNDGIEYRIISPQSYEIGRSYLSLTNTAKTLISSCTEYEEAPAVPIADNVHLTVQKIGSLYNTKTHGIINYVTGEIIHPEEFQGKQISVLTFAKPIVGTEERPIVFSLDRCAINDGTPKTHERKRPTLEPLIEAYGVHIKDIAVGHKKLVGIDIRTEEEVPGTELNKLRTDRATRAAAAATRQPEEPRQLRPFSN